MSLNFAKIMKKLDTNLKKQDEQGYNIVLKSFQVLQNSIESKDSFIEQMHKLEDFKNTYSNVLKTISKFDFIRRGKLKKIKTQVIEEMTILGQEAKKEEKQNELRQAYLKATEGLAEGPRKKEDSTYQLESLVKGILNNSNQINSRYNELDELVITVNQSEFNLTEILANNPDFEQLSFGQVDLTNYIKFLNDKNIKVKSEAHFAKADVHNELNHLDYAEKIAGSMFTGFSYYKNLQELLRDQTESTVLKSNSQNQLAITSQVTEFLSTICIAAHGLSKPSPQHTIKYETLLRGENNVTEINQQRDADIAANRSTTSKGFTSASTSMPFKGDTTIEYIQPSNSFAKNIAPISSWRGEDESLFAPGTQFKFTSSTMVENKGETLKKYTAVAVRPIDSIMSKMEFSKKFNSLKQHGSVLSSCMKNIINEITTQTSVASQASQVSDVAQIKEDVKDLIQSAYHLNNVSGKQHKQDIDGFINLLRSEFKQVVKAAKNPQVAKEVQTSEIFTPQQHMNMRK